MLVSGGKILALSKVSADNTLKGLGTPDSPLGINNPEQYAQKEWVENTFVSADYLKENYWTSGQVEERIHQIPGATNYSAGKNISQADIERYIVSVEDSAFEPYAKKDDVEREYAKKTDLSPYALTSAVNQKFNETSSWANEAFQPKGDYATKTDVRTTSSCIVSWVETNYWTSAQINDILADFGGYEFTQAGADGKPVLPQGEEPSNKKIYLTENTSAVGLDRYFNWIYDISTQDFTCVGDTSVDLEGYAKTDWVNSELNKKVNNDDFDTYSAGIATTLGNKLDKNDFDAWSANTFNGYAKTDDVNAQFSATSAWAKQTFQLSGDYVSATDFAKLTEDVSTLSADFADYKTEVEQKFEETSSWANDTFQPKGNYVSAEPFNTWAEGIDDALDAINDNFQSISADLENISAGLEKKLNTEDFEAWQEGKDFTSYSAGEGIDVQNHLISLAPSALDNYYKKSETWSSAAISNEFSSTSAWANDTFQPKGDYLTTDEADERYLPLSANLHNVVVTSQDESVSVIPTSADGIVTYDLSVPAPAAEVNISGENGVSAKYDAEASAWMIGLEDHAYQYLEANESTATTVTAAKQVLNNFDQTTVVGSNISVDVDGNIVFGNTGLYHIDIQVDVNVVTPDFNYYTSLLELVNYSSGTIGTTIKATTHEIDWSYEHTETINVSFDFKVNTAGRGTAIAISQLPLQGKASVRVRNINIHEVVTIDSIFDGDAPVYTEGEAISITDGADGKAINVKFDSASGLGLNENGQLVVKLGKGLKFDDTAGAVEGTLILDDVTEEVVEVVQDLQVELEGKLTVNMNVSDAKNVGSPFYGGSTPCLGAALFTVPLNHKLNTNSEVSFFTSQAMNQSNSFPIMIGILEYDFAYMDPDVGKRARTKWIGDTGLIWSDTPAVDGNTIGDSAAGANRKYTFKLKNLTPVIEEEVTVGGVKYINKVGPELRSDRAYYLVMFSRAPQGLEYFLSDQGYATPTNSNPLISFYCDNMKYYEYDGAVGQDMSQWSTATWSAHANDLAMSAVDFWDRGGEANSIYRPFVMIRNNV